MRYERRSDGGDGHPASRRLRWSILAAVVLLTGATVGSVLAVSSSGHAPSVPARAALQSVFLEANIFLENIGSPPPAGVVSPDWALRSVPVVNGRGPAHLAVTEHSWLNAAGHITLLSRSDGAAVLATQRNLVDQLFTGPLHATVGDELDQIVSAEERSANKLASPGGAKITSWLGISQEGDRATVEAIVENWVQLDTVSQGTAGPVLSASIQDGSVDAKASLVRVAGRWRVESLSQAPWLEPT